VRTVLDLRGPDEAAREGHGLLADTAVRRMNLPVSRVRALVTDTVPATTADDGDATGFYLGLLDGSGESLVSAARVVADTDQYVAPRNRPGKVSRDELEFAERHGRHRSGTAAVRGCLFCRAQLARSTVKHGVDELVPVGGAEALGELHALVDDDAVGHVRSMQQLEQADPEHRSLDRVELAKRPVDERLQSRIQRRDRRGNPIDQAREVFLLGITVALFGGELSVQLGRALAGELPLIERLHRELSRQAARAR